MNGVSTMRTMELHSIITLSQGYGQFLGKNNRTFVCERWHISAGLFLNPVTSDAVVQLEISCGNNGYYKVLTFDEFLETEEGVRLTYLPYGTDMREGWTKVVETKVPKRIIKLIVDAYKVEVGIKQRKSKVSATD